MLRFVYTRPVISGRTVAAVVAPFSSPIALAAAAAAAAVVGTMALFPVLSRPATRPAPGAAWEKEVVELVAEGRGRINYEAGVVKAVGLGAVAPPSISKSKAQRVLDARGAALADALRNMSLTVSKVRVDADTRVENYVMRSDKVKVRVKTFVHNAEVIEERLLPTSGMYRIVVQASLNGNGSLAEAMGVDPKPSKKVVMEEPRETPAPEPTPNPFAPGAPAPAGAEYTSLVIDCRGLRVAPTMSPRLFDDHGQEVYGTVKVPYDYAIETGIVAYPRSMDQVRRCGRAGDRPLVVQARGVADRFRFCPVISGRDAERVREANRSGRFFERTAVIFVVDGEG